MEVSVIIPAYNAGSQLLNTIECIVKSGLSDYEIIIVNDGSTDSTEFVCQAAANERSNIRVFSQANSGVSAARNRGIREAAGEYILFFDADDSVDPLSLHAIESLLCQNTPDMLLFGMSFDYYHKGQVYRQERFSLRDSGCYSRAELPFDALYRANYLSPVWNKLIKRDLIQKNGIRFSEDMFLMEDLLFSLHCLAHCETVYICPDVIYRYRQSEDEGNAYRRLRRIPSLTQYLRPFEEALSKHGNILNELYYMLLGQRLRFASLEEIKKEAQDFAESRYAADAAAYSLGRKLLAGEFGSIYLNNRKSIVRHAIANKVKQSGLYRKRKGNGELS